MNYQALLEGNRHPVCEFCYRWNPRGMQVRQGHVSIDVRQYICTKGSSTEKDMRELINEPCFNDDWLVCSLNPDRVLQSERK